VFLELEAAFAECSRWMWQSHEEESWNYNEDAMCMYHIIISGLSTLGNAVLEQMILHPIKQDNEQQQSSKLHIYCLSIYLSLSCMLNF
jgi:hypothetical protein